MLKRSSALAGTSARTRIGRTSESGGTVTDGLIVLGLLAVLFAIFGGRIRRRAGMPVNSRIYIAMITGFVIVVLVLWAAKH
jgi:hypothetical protein